MRCLERRKKGMMVSILVQMAVFVPIAILASPSWNAIWICLAAVALQLAVLRPFCHMLAYMREEDAKYYKAHGHCPCEDCIEAAKKDHGGGH